MNLRQENVPVADQEVEVEIEIDAPQEIAIRIEIVIDMMMIVVDGVERDRVLDQIDEDKVDQEVEIETNLINK
jgi:hypothetical protein